MDLSETERVWRSYRLQLDGAGHPGAAGRRTGSRAVGGSHGGPGGVAAAEWSTGVQCRYPRRQRAVYPAGDPGVGRGRPDGPVAPVGLVGRPEPGGDERPRRRLLVAGPGAVALGDRRKDGKSVTPEGPGTAGLRRLNPSTWLVWTGRAAGAALLVRNPWYLMAPGGVA